MKTRAKSESSAAPADILSGQLTPQMTFAQRVWTLTSRIPRGRVATYRDIAAALQTRAYRAVGQALHNNPYAPAVPCHRVVGSGGRLTGYSGGLPEKARLLAAEGVPCKAGRVIGLAEHSYLFQ